MPSPGLPASVNGLIAELKKLPGVGEKTATRYVLHLLGRGRDAADALGTALSAVSTKVRPCPRCHFLADGDLCELCRDPGRDASVVCVVEGAPDLLAIEKMGEYRGSYHVLGGAISALRGVTPDRLRIRELVARVDAGGVAEVIVATGADAEGETTALYVRKALEGRAVRVTRPATGIPMGSSIEFLDSVTLLRALRGRKEL
jgi:recombination protein RecR